jgi:2-polyprenyl-3-methyl-5-hydroxy-6-metoxy-1,4-benzoquinol methylase
VLLKYFEHVRERLDFTGNRTRRTRHTLLETHHSVVCASVTTGLRAVELGAGCGLVGIALAWLGAEVHLTDLYDQIVRSYARSLLEIHSTPARCVVVMLTQPNRT